MGCNWNNVFAYSTLKTVQIRDWRLGLLHYALEIGIFIYILYEIITKQLYIQKSPVVAGSIRTSLRLDPSTIPSAVPSFCSEIGGGCLFWTEREAVFPDVSDNSIFITTRVSITTYPTPPARCGSSQFVFLSNASDYSCAPFRNQTGIVTPRVSYYIPNVELMTVMIDHTARSAIDSPVALSSNNMVGKMYNTNGKEVLDFDERYHASNVDKGINGDIISVADILSAAGVDLSKLSGAPGAKADETQRSAGIVVSFLINYQNRLSSFKNINDVSLKYKYFPTQVPKTEYKVSQNVFNTNGTTSVLERHGIYIVFAQSGQIGEFSFIALLSNLVASIALLKVASLIVDFLMTMVLPEKKAYKEAKTQVTDEMSKPRASLEDPIEVREGYTQQRA